MIDSSPTFLSIILSVLAVGISVLSLWLSWKAFDRDRDDLKIFVDYFSTGGRGANFQVELINFGRRVVVVSKVKVLLSRYQIVEYAAYVPGLHKLPLKLNENETVTFEIPILDDHYKKLIPDPKLIRGISVEDTRKRKYRFPDTSLVSKWRWRKIANQLSIDFSKRKDTRGWIG